MASNPQQLDLFVQPLVDVYAELEIMLFDMIVRRLKSDTPVTSDNVLMWQMDKMSQLHALDRDMIKKMASASNISTRKLYKVLRDAGFEELKQTDRWAQKLAKGGFELAAVTEPTTLIDRIVKTFYVQAVDNYNLINQTMLLQSKLIYQDILNQTTASVLTGLKTHKEALADTMNQFADKGIPALIDKAGKRWSTEAYIRNVTRTTVNNVFNHVEDERNKEYGIDLMRVSQHVGARPTCSIIQGTVISMLGIAETIAKYGTKYKSVFDPELEYGKGNGVFGCNCAHKKVGFVEGVNIAPEPSEKIDEAENVRVRLLRQTQRRLERDVRAAKRRLSAAETLGNDESIQKAKKLIRERQKAVREFTKEHKLTRQYDREKIFD
ncbi:phage minor capsid protein [Listeria booriae]|uniref:phage minor capsid protein n=1 Tax=Listeria booriae TaxID=1552123 RepID=UPI001627EFF8|nr:phage minor capsid protein [Listeria booriae]MBC2318776.1 minor capsid protein [Listeria booriae]